jgi:diguanylate cyclase (GGDEF)-like protein
VRPAPAPARRSVWRLYATYALLGLIPVGIIGALLSQSFNTAAQARGLAQARSEAVLLAQTVVDPLLSGQPLDKGLSGSSMGMLNRDVAHALSSHAVLRFRIRDLAGRVVYSQKGMGPEPGPDDEALEASQGRTVARLTHLNSDSTGTSNAGSEAVEVYMPLRAGPSNREVGVLEVYLPYGPIDAEVSADLNTLYRNLGIALALIYLVLFGISVWVSRDLRRQVARNAYLAEHDVLTDLANRSLFRQRLEQALASASPSGPVAVAIVDLDRFKDVNDTIGHRNGDALLRELARRVADAAAPTDTVARLGGDEFGLILAHGQSPEVTLRELRALLNVETVVGGLPLSIEASVGYAVAPHDGTGVYDMLQRAEIAMYEAKYRRSGVVRYTPELDSYDAANLRLVSELRHSIEQGALRLHYQPKLVLDTGEVVAAEALLRWEHPSQGLLPPGRFLPLVEHTDLIFEVTEWVLDAALGDLARLPDELSVAINVSARSVVSDDFAMMIIDALERHKVEPRRLVIEMTETALLVDPAGAASVLRVLARHGVRVSIDDFGSGQTSLSYLSTLPISELKIDRIFVSDVLEDAGHAAIVQSIVDLGHNLGLRVVGEGVETGAVLDHLRSTGCDEAQGYVLARPMSLDRLVDWLDAHEPDPGSNSLN